LIFLADVVLDYVNVNL